MLPDGFHWLDDDGVSYLRRGYGCVAVVRAGRIEILRGRKSRPMASLEGHCGSLAHGKRQVERWLQARVRRRLWPS